MGSSWVSLGNEIPQDQQTPWLGLTYGFWVKDWPLVTLLSAMGEVIDERSDVAAWLKELRENWIDLNEIAGSGCCSPRLEDYITNSERRAALLEIVLSTLQRLLDANGDYYQAFPSTKPRDDHVLPVLRLGDKVGLIELASNVARLLCNAIYAGEHSPVRWGYAPDKHWMSPS